jgi:hypothetical protein
LQIGVGPAEFDLVSPVTVAGIRHVDIYCERFAAVVCAVVLNASRRRVAVDCHRFADGACGIEGAQGEDARGDDDDAGETSER